jgi:parallel beta-helix repeat protein/predicted outer membrane repeat protein
MKTSKAAFPKILLVALLAAVVLPLTSLAGKITGENPSLSPPAVSPQPADVPMPAQRSPQQPLVGDTVYFNFDANLEGWRFATAPDTVSITYICPGTVCDLCGGLFQSKYPFQLSWGTLGIYQTLKYEAHHLGYYEDPCAREFWSKAIWVPVGTEWKRAERLEARIYNAPYDSSYYVWAKFGYKKVGDPDWYYPGGGPGWFLLVNSGWTKIFLDEPSPGEFDSLEAIAITIGAYFNEGNIYVDWVRGILPSKILRVPSEYPTIKAAIDAAVDGDTILVAPGTYTGDGNRDLLIINKSIVLKSETGPQATIIDCQGGWLNYHGGISIYSDTSGGVVVDGFTIRNAYREGEGQFYTAGIYLSNSNSTIRNCILEDNKWHGIYCINSEPVIENCVFRGNVGSLGGGIYSDYANPQIRNCLFDGNTATRGGAIYAWENLFLMVENCTFVNNSADSSGGAIWFSSSASESGVYNSLFAFNKGGGAITLASSSYSLYLYCCDIYGNVGGDWVDSIASQFGIEGNFSHDPLFCDFPSGNYLLTANSPCAPANNSCGSLIGLYNVDCGAIELALSPDSIGFIAAEGGANPSPVTLSITNAGGGILNWTLSKSASWLVASAIQGTAPSNVNISVNITGMTAGEYYDVLTISSEDAVNSPQYVPVTLSIQTQGVIEVTPASISFTADSGGSNPTPQQLLITNAGSGSLSWQSAKSAPWLALSDTSGTAPSTIMVSADIAGLSPQTYHDTSLSFPKTPSIRRSSCRFRSLSICPIVRRSLCRFAAMTPSRKAKCSRAILSPMTRMAIRLLFPLIAPSIRFTIRL